MLCEKCGVKNATTHIRTVINGQVHEKHLCSQCAKDVDYNAANVNNNTQLLTSILYGDNIASTTTRCIFCGSSFNDIVKNGKCGCPQCYTTFYEKLLPSIKKAQGVTVHNGKVPNKVNSTQKSNANQIYELKLLIRQYIKEEKYEEAAVVRDKIKSLEEGEMQ